MFIHCTWKVDSFPITFSNVESNEFLIVSKITLQT